MNPSARVRKRIISKWTIALLILALPLVAYLFIYLTDDPESKPPPPTLEQLLEDAQIVGGVKWKLRSTLFRILPGRARDVIGLKNPRGRYYRQISALNRFAQISGEAERKIPVLTNILQQTTNEMVFMVACVELGRLGPNAAATLPMILDLVTTRTGVDKLYLLDAAVMIGPNGPEVRRIVTNRLAQIIATHSLQQVPVQPHMMTSNDRSALSLLTLSLPALGIGDLEIEGLFAAAYASNNPEIVATMFGTVPLSETGPRLYKLRLVESLVLSWDDQCGPLLKSFTTGSMVPAALKYDQTLHIANRVYQELLANEFVSTQEALTSYNAFVDAERAVPLKQATDDTVLWLESSPQDYLWDSGVWMEKLRWKDASPDPKLNSWLLERALAKENPNQVVDWGRYLRKYGEIRKAAGAAVEILKIGQTAKQELLLERLSQVDPSQKPKLVLDEAFRRRYGLNKAGSANSGDVMYKLLGSLPPDEWRTLLDDLIGAIRNLDSSMKSRDQALDRLTQLKLTLEEGASNNE